LSKSGIEALLAWQMRAAGLPEPERELHFHPARAWRFDFAFPGQKLAIEVMGGLWLRKSGHTSGTGITRDYVKLNEAQLLGWRILHVTSKQVESGEALAWVLRALDKE